ncbi:MAG: helix-turn-helix domain-containing protein [Oscillatoriaceae cyanobacterium Prado104]|jgi:excisionase family DNA binding protein|nr:helix-turn-helix domain-containing protein [Oscillatoriaceae cyanobacterium Prado104]
MEASEKTISIGDAAKQLGISTTTLRKWADTGKIRFKYSLSGQRRFFLEDIQSMTPRELNQLSNSITVNYDRFSRYGLMHDDRSGQE